MTEWLGFRLKGARTSPGPQEETLRQQGRAECQKLRAEVPQRRRGPKSAGRVWAMHTIWVWSYGIKISPDVPPYGTFWSFPLLSLRTIAFCGQKTRRGLYGVSYLAICLTIKRVETYALMRGLPRKSEVHGRHSVRPGSPRRSEKL